MLAMLVGASLALLGLFVELDAPAPRVPAGAVAIVDGTPIPEADYERALAALAADLRRPLTDADRRHVIDRLIDELLLVEHGLALGLVRSDPYLRTAVSRAVLDRVQAEVATGEAASELELRSHHRAHPERFAATDRIALDGLFFRTLDDAARAREQWVRGEPRRTFAARALRPALALPSTPLPPGKLRDYLGPRASELALALEVGQISEPIAVEGGAWLLECRARTLGRARPFAEVRELVEADLRREREDQALRERIAALRDAAVIVIREESDE
ncbi:peptidylprolyl isomerase [Nannocystaceae bacterium ST9]